METNEALKLALKAGEIMLGCGAETYRVEDTMKRILNSCQFKTSDVFVTTTGVFCCAEKEGEAMTTALKRVGAGGQEFWKMIGVNDVSRKFTAGEITGAEALAKLEALEDSEKFPRWLVVLSLGVGSGCFCYLLGGNLSDSINAFMTGMILETVLVIADKAKLQVFLRQILIGAVLALVARTLFAAGLGTRIDKVIIGALITTLPGLSITSGIRDIVDGDLLSGMTRMTDSLLRAVAVAVGVGAVQSLWGG
jgi:uncharacterized membrane protein YjjP (DUF1212 family)